MNNAPDYNDNLFFDPVKNDLQKSGLIYAIDKLNKALDYARDLNNRRLFNNIYDAKSTLEHIFKNS